MKVKVTVKPSSKYEKIEEAFDGSLKIWVKEPAKEGRANAEIVKLLAKFYEVARSEVSIVNGKTSRVKIIEVKKY